MYKYKREEVSRMNVKPRKQFNHRLIDRKIMPWLDLHFPADSSFNGRVFLAYRRKDVTGIYDLNRSNIGDLKPFIAEMHVSRNMDYYITANSVCGVRRVTNDVFGLHNIVIDVDCHEDTLSPTLTAAFIWRCTRDLWNTGLCPEPNSIVFSGRGVQLWWALEPASAKIQYWYKRMQAWLMDTLQGVLDESPEELGELSIDRSASIRLAGLFRLPFTYNTKTGRRGSAQVRNQERYNLRRMIERYVPAEYNPNKKERSQYRWTASEDGLEVPAQEYVPLAKHDAEVLRGGTTAMAARVHQLVRLRALRNAPMGQEMRDRFCFTVYCALLADYEQEEAWKRLLAFNEGFKQPLPYSDLDQMMSSATEKKYRLTNTWVIGELEITDEEQEAIGLKPTTSDAVVRKRGKKTRDIIRKTVKEDRDNKIFAMHSDGTSKAEIARVLGIGRSTVIRVVSALEAQRAAEEAIQEAEEAAKEQMAAGAEPLNSRKNNEQGNCFKTVPNNIVFYGTTVSSGGGRSKSSAILTITKGLDPPS